MKKNRTLHLMASFAIAICSFTSFAQPSYSSSDQDTSSYKIKLLPGGKIGLWPLPPNATGIATLAGQFDLNDDGKNEILVCLGMRDTSIYASAIYSPDKNGNYKCILSPNYWGRIEVSTVQSEGWKHLLVYGEPYFKTLAQQDDMILLDFIEPRPLAYVFSQSCFVKKTTAQGKESFTSSRTSSLLPPVPDIY